MKTPTWTKEKHIVSIRVCGVCSYPGQAGHESCMNCGSRKIATQFDTQAWQLNPGDQIRNEIGQVMKVQRVRPHETSFNHVYVDTYQGTTLARRGDSFTVAPHNSRQQSMPGYGNPGGNANYLPMDAYQHNNSLTTAVPAGHSPHGGGGNALTCPSCGSHTLALRGDHYLCSRCGNTMGVGSASGHQFGNQTSIINVSSIQHTSAVGRRATALLNEGEHTK